MKLENTFRIPVPAEDVWPVLLDLERIAPCVPGATLTSRNGDDFHGRIKVKLGPVGLTYNGIIKVLSQDEDAKVAVLEGGGRETGGNGTAKAAITCRLVENDGETEVFVDTDLAITGKPAQFGRGALAEVAGTLIGAFAGNLAAEITSSAPETGVARRGAAVPGPSITRTPESLRVRLSMYKCTQMEGTAMSLVLLGAAIVAEIIGTSLLRATEGFTRFWPTVASLSAYALAFVLLARAISQGMQVGFAYAVWSGLGTTLIVIIGALFLGESLSAAKIVGVALVVAGVVTLNLAGAH